MHLRSEVAVDLAAAAVAAITAVAAAAVADGDVGCPHVVFDFENWNCDANCWDNNLDFFDAPDSKADDYDYCHMILVHVPEVVSDERPCREYVWSFPWDVY